MTDEMKSPIISLIRLDKPVPQPGKWICTAHGRKECSAEIVAIAELQTEDAVQPYRVCERWLTENARAVRYLAERGYDNR